MPVKVSKAHPRGLPSQKDADQLATHIRKGADLQTAAVLAAVNPKDAAEWAQTGKAFVVDRKRKTANAELYIDFYETIARAEADYESELLAKVRQQALSGKSWQAAARLLEAHKPERYGKRPVQQVEVLGTLRVQALELKTSKGRRGVRGSAVAVTEAKPLIRKGKPDSEDV